MLKKLSATTLIIQTIVSVLLVLGMRGAVMAAGPNTPPNPTNSPADEKKLDDAIKKSVGIDDSKCGTGPNTSGTPCASESFNVNKYLNASGQEQSYLKSGNPIGSFIVQVVNFLVLTIGSLCLVALVIGGFVLLVSHGNENALTKGKDIIKDALIGLVVVLCSYFITAFVQNLFYDLPK